MDLRPWGYWTRDGQPYDETRQVQATLEKVLAAQHEPPGCAAPVDSPVGIDRHARSAPKRKPIACVPLMPGAGHMVHMAAHIYQRVGRHADVISVEPAGGEGGRRLHRAVPRAGALSARLLPAQPALHLDGCVGERADGARDRLGAQARRRRFRARRSASCRSCRASSSCPTGRWCASSEWDADPRRQGPAARRRRSRAACGATRGRWRSSPRTALDEAERSSRELQDARRGSVAQRADDVLGQQRAGDHADRAGGGRRRDRRQAEGLGSRRCCISIAPCASRTRSSTRSRTTGTCRRGRTWRRAAAAGRADEAETVLWEDLKRNPEHGWTLALLSKALKMQNKTQDAALIDARFAKSWKGADAAPEHVAPVLAMVHSVGAALSAGMSFADVRLANGVRLHYAQQGPRCGPGDRAAARLLRFVVLVQPRDAAAAAGTARDRARSARSRSIRTTGRRLSHRRNGRAMSSR